MKERSNFYNTMSPKVSGMAVSALIVVQLVLLSYPAALTAADMQPVSANGGEIMVEIHGSGEPVLMIHGTGVAATFALTMADPALANYRIIRMHRRGFGGSSPTPVPFTIADHAADAAAVLDALGIDKAHIVGHSFGGSVALQFGVDFPEKVQSLAISDAALFDVAPPVFFELIDVYESGDKETAMNRFSTLSYGQDWRSLALRVDPNGPEQVFNDVDTVFLTEAQAMIEWTFGEADAVQLTGPMLYFTGSRGANASLASLQNWIDRVIDVAVIPDATHAVLMQEPEMVADALAAFFSRYPMNNE